MAKVFGTTPGGDTVHEAALISSAGATASVIGYGASLRDLVIPVGGRQQRVVLGLETLEHYLQYSRHFGATAGRVANRIRGGQFTLDGKTYELDRNLNGQHTLHGGKSGFGKRVWALKGSSADQATFTLLSPDGDNGFPGELSASCAYAFTAPLTLSVTLEATTTKPTPVNLVHHSYFNLDGAPQVRDHSLQVEADYYTPSDDENMPSGDIRKVAGTAFDFRVARALNAPLEGLPQAYDANYILNRTDRGQARDLFKAATFSSPSGDVAMEVWTTEPAIQVYDSGTLDCPVPGLGGQVLKRFAGLCLEPQAIPNSPNVAHFSPCILRPGETYHQRTEFRFKVKA